MFRSVHLQEVGSVTPQLPLPAEAFILEIPGSKTTNMHFCSAFGDMKLSIYPHYKPDVFSCLSQIVFVSLGKVLRCPSETSGAFHLRF